MRARIVATVVVAVVVGFGGFGILAADAANPAGFTAVVNPLRELPASGALAGVSCPSSSECVAVGVDVGDLPLVLSGDPSSWGVGQAKEITLGSSFDKNLIFGSQFSSVACTSATWCVAVGGDGSDLPLVMAGNPATWGPAQAREIKLASTLNPASGFGSWFAGVSCTSPTWCVAVGSDGNFQPLVMAGNPATWSAKQTKEIKLGSAFGSKGWLYEVRCTSASACVAVGTDQHGRPLVLRGNPSKWTAAQAHEIALGSAFGSGGSLFSVACPSASLCVAVGRDKHRQPFMLAGNPSTWKAAQAHEITLGSAFGSGGSLYAVTCTSASSCVGVGSDKSGEPLMVAGGPSTAWTEAQAREIALGNTFSSGGDLDAIACSSSSACVATGIDANSEPLVLTGDPATWGASQAAEISLKGAAFGVKTYTETLTCLSGGSCLEIGLSEGWQGYSPYSVHGSAATWDQATATPTTGVNRFIYGATCPSPAYCVAVGWDTTTRQPVVLVGDPSNWGAAQAHVITLGSTFGSGGYLASIACASTTSCVAVGADANFQPLLLSGDPASWSAANAKQLTLGTKFHSGGGLESITCQSATACFAAGFTGQQQQPLVLSGNPSTWTPAAAKQITLGSAFGNQGTLSSIACTSSTYCVGVGQSGGAVSKPLVLAGNPATWNASSAFNMAVAATTSTTVAGPLRYGYDVTGTGYLASVSCDQAASCVAVGGDKTSAPLYIAGNPSQWKGQPLVRPAKNGASFRNGSLTTTSCTPTACFAGGFANGGDFIASFGTPELLTVTQAGSGTGLVTSSPAGISCGASCTHAFTAGTVVTLTATPASGSSFSGWSGACSGTGNCVVSMSAAETVQATFDTGGHVYWVNEGGGSPGTVNEVSSAGGSVTFLAGGLDQPMSVAVDETHVYWGNYGATGLHPSVEAVPLGGGAATTLAIGQQGPYSVAVDGTNVYWVNIIDGTVNTVPLGGGTVTTLASGQGNPVSVAVFGTNVYWVTQGDYQQSNGTVNEVPVAGGTVTTLASGQNLPDAVTVSGTGVYWVNFGDGTVNEVPLGGGSVTTLATGQGQPSSVAVDGGHVYWVDSKGAPNGTVDEVPLGGGAVTTLASGQDAPCSVAVDNAYVYWVDRAFGSWGTVNKVPIGGGSVTTLASGQSNPLAIAVGP